MDTLNETVDLLALGYDFSAEDARQWATACRETPKKWASKWADALRAHAADTGIPCPPRGVIRRAILKTMEEA